MPALSAVQALTGIALPAEAALRRDLPPFVRFRTDDPALRARYDDRVLYYAAAYLKDRGSLRLYGPKALNFKALLQAAEIRADGEALSLTRMRHFKRYVTSDYALAQPADTVTLGFEGRHGAMPILNQDSEIFAGRNVLYTMSQNNDPDWIRDWLCHHHRHHGADALLLADNASTTYTPEALFDELASLPFLKALRIISVPFKYGPSSAICRRASSARYLQSAIANLSRDLYLTRARVVVSCDIDELVISKTGQSIFDACAKRRLGFVTVPGYWRFAKPGVRPSTHADHVWSDPTRAKACPTKYAIAPQGLLGRKSWMTHSLEGVPRSLFASRDFWFAHCYGISLKWKEGREDHTGMETWQRDEAITRHWQSSGEEPTQPKLE